MLAVAVSDTVALLAVLATLVTALVAHTHRVREWRYARRYDAISDFFVACHAMSDELSVASVVLSRAPNEKGLEDIKSALTRVTVLRRSIDKSVGDVFLVCSQRTSNRATIALNALFELSAATLHQLYLYQDEAHDYHSWNIREPALREVYTAALSSFHGAARRDVKAETVRQRLSVLWASVKSKIKNLFPATRPTR